MSLSDKHLSLIISFLLNKVNKILNFKVREHFMKHLDLTLCLVLYTIYSCIKYSLLSRNINIFLFVCFYETLLVSQII